MNRAAEPAPGLYASWPPLHDAEGLCRRMPWAVFTGTAAMARIQVRAAREDVALYFVNGWVQARVAWLPGVPGVVVDLAAVPWMEGYRASLLAEDAAMEPLRHRKRAALPTAVKGRVW